MFAAITLGVPVSLRFMPAAVINLPNEQYWLAPERRDRTMRCFAEHFAWFGVGSLALMVAVINVVMRANLTPGQLLDPAWFGVPIALYLAFFAWWIVRVVTMFRLRPEFFR